MRNHNIIKSSSKLYIELNQVMDPFKSWKISIVTSKASIIITVKLVIKIVVYDIYWTYARLSPLVMLDSIIGIQINSFLFYFSTTFVYGIYLTIVYFLRLWFDCFCFTIKTCFCKHVNAILVEYKHFPDKGSVKFSD